MRKLLLLSFLFPIFCQGQIEKLKPEFRNVSWIIDDKTAEIVSTLSHHFKDDALLNDSSYVSKKEYNLYYDSLSLWYITRPKVSQDNDSTAKATTLGDFTVSDRKLSIDEKIRQFEKTTISLYKKGNDSTNYINCVPSSYENLKLFYATESKRIKSYNSGRIKVYEYIRKDKNSTVKFYLAFHKKIKPVDYKSVKMGIGPWIPYFYIYSKPKHKVYLASTEKLWESKTGLPYSLAQELSLSDKRIPKILKKLGSVNDDVLIKEAPVIHEPEPIADKTFNITVECDTCDVKLFDHSTEDGDIVDFTYKKIKERISIIKKGTNHKIILEESNYFLLRAVSEGFLLTCTVNVIIDNQEHTFTMNKGEIVKIKLNKQ